MASESRIQASDELGFRVELDRRPERIVSLVPSWTETPFAFGLDREIVGVTRFCMEPADAVASRPKVGGTKNPDIEAIVKLAPDLVIANAEENRREDVERLREVAFEAVGAPRPDGDLHSGVAECPCGRGADPRGGAGGDRGLPCGRDGRHGGRM